MRRIIWFLLFTQIFLVSCNFSDFLGAREEFSTNTLEKTQTTLENQVSVESYLPENESSFDILLPLASFNSGDCLEMEKNECGENANSLIPIRVTNSFEIWQEMQLTFTIKPNCKEPVTIKSKDSIIFEVYDYDGKSWETVRYQIVRPNVNLLDLVDNKYYSICYSDGSEIIWFGVGLPITLAFSRPQDFNDSNLLFRLTVIANKVDRDSGVVLSEEITESKFIEYRVADSVDTLINNWEGIDIEDLNLLEANQEFELLVPVDLNPFLYTFPINITHSYINLVLQFNNELDIQFDENLGLEVHQFNKNGSTWQAIQPLSQTFTSIHNLSISNFSSNVICTGCNFFDKSVDDYYSMMVLPRMMNVNGERYLVFSINVDASNLDPETEYLRFIAKAGNKFSFIDVALPNE
jgi:hypothetical protein